MKVISIKWMVNHNEYKELVNKEREIEDKINDLELLKAKLTHQLNRVKGLIDKKEMEILEDINRHTKGF